MRSIFIIVLIVLTFAVQADSSKHPSIFLFVNGTSNQYRVHFHNTGVTETGKWDAQTFSDITIRGTVESLFFSMEKMEVVLHENSKETSNIQEIKKNVEIQRKEMHLKNFHEKINPEDAVKHWVKTEITSILPFIIPILKDEKTWNTRIPVNLFFFDCENSLKMIDQQYGIISTIGNYKYRNNKERIEKGKLSFVMTTKINFKRKIIDSCSYVFTQERKESKDINKFSLKVIEKAK